MKRRVLSFVLTAALSAALLSGCGNSSNGSDTVAVPAVESSVEGGADEGSSPTAADSDSADVQQADPFGKSDPPVEISVVQSVTVGADQEDRSENNSFLQFVEDTYGIKITHKWITTPEQYDQKIALSLATDDLADVMVVDMVTMEQMIEAGQAMDITDVWNEYADELTKSLIAPEGTTGLEMATRDGRIYGIPMTTPVYETMHGLFLREDWREQLGLPEPNSFEELEQILYAFVEQDPDGNGVDDTYGIGLNKDLYGDGYEITSIANMMHAYPNAWVKNEEGRVVYGSVQPEMKPVLETLAKWYADGLIDPEFTVKNTDKEAELVLKEQMGAFFGVQWAQFMSNAVVDLYINNPESDWNVYKIPSVDEEPAKPIVYDNTRQFMVVTAGCEHPEAAIRLLDIMHKLGAGDCTDVLLTVDDFNEVWKDWTWMPVRPESIHGNIPKWVAVFEALEKDDPSLVSYNYNALALYNTQKEMAEHPEYRTSDGNRAEKEESAQEFIKGQWGTRFSGYIFGMATELAEKDLLTYDQCGAIVTDTMVDSLAQLEKMELETFTRIITGDASVDEFDTFVENWNRMGGSQITEEINEFYGIK